jgi:hypothetical protein
MISTPRLLQNTVTVASKLPMHYFESPKMMKAMHLVTEKDTQLKAQKIFYNCPYPHHENLLGGQTYSSTYS